MDTARDYRILVAEDALYRLERRVKSWSLPWPLDRRRVQGALGDIRRALLKLKYSFLPVDLLLESSELSVVSGRARELASLLLPRPGYEQPRSLAGKLALAEVRYALSVLVGLPGRLRLGGENRPEYAVDIVGVEVTRVEELTERVRL